MGLMNKTQVGGMMEKNGNVKLLEDIKKYIDEKIKNAFNSLNLRFDSMQGNFRKQSEQIEKNHKEMIFRDMENKIDIKEIKSGFNDIQANFKETKANFQELKDLINKNK